MLWTRFLILILGVLNNPIGARHIGTAINLFLMKILTWGWEVVSGYDG